MSLSNTNNFVKVDQYEAIQFSGADRRDRDGPVRGNVFRVVTSCPEDGEYAREECEEIRAWTTPEYKKSSGGLYVD